MSGGAARRRPELAVDASGADNGKVSRPGPEACEGSVRCRRLAAWLEGWLSREGISATGGEHEGPVVRKLWGRSGANRRPPLSRPLGSPHISCDEPPSLSAHKDSACTQTLGKKQVPCFSPRSLQISSDRTGQPTSRKISATQKASFSSVSPASPSPRTQTLRHSRRRSCSSFLRHSHPLPHRHHDRLRFHRTRPKARQTKTSCPPPHAHCSRRATHGGHCCFHPRPAASFPPAPTHSRRAHRQQLRAARPQTRRGAPCPAASLRRPMI